MNGVKIKVDTRILIFLSAFFFLLVDGANVSYPSNNESGGSGSMPPGMIKGSSTDPKTGIRTDAVRHPDGTTTITQFDSSGKMISQQTKRDPRSKPQASKGRGWFGRPPEAMPVQKPAENPKDVVMSGNATDPKTRIRTEGVCLRDGTTTITQFDKNGNRTGQTTKEGGAKDVAAHPTDPGDNGPAPGGGNSSQDPALTDGNGQGESSKAAEINQWIKDTFGESGGVEMEIVDAEPIAPTSGGDWGSLPEPNANDSNNPYSLGGVKEPAPQNVDIVEVTKQDSAVSHVAFDAGRGEAVVVMKNGTTMTADNYLKSKETAGSGKSELPGKVKEDAQPSQEGDSITVHASPGGTATATLDFQAEGGSHKSAGHPAPTLCPGSTCVVSVRFAPSAVGIRAGTLTITSSVLSTDSDTIFYDVDGSPLMPVDLKNQSKKLGKALDGYLKEGIKNPFQSSNALQLDGYFGKWSNSSSQASLADLFQGDNFGGAASSTASTGSSCN